MSPLKKKKLNIIRKKLDKIDNSLINIIKNVKINKYPRGRTKPSDHTPIELELV